ncbi:MAG: hypothetical protein DRJ01_18370, partial [Bacteroidetes bacterium]
FFINKQDLEVCSCHPKRGTNKKSPFSKQEISPYVEMTNGNTVRRPANQYLLIGIERDSETSWLKPARFPIIQITNDLNLRL